MTPSTPTDGFPGAGEIITSAPGPREGTEAEVPRCAR